MNTLNFLAQCLGYFWITGMIFLFAYLIFKWFRLKAVSNKLPPQPVIWEQSDLKKDEKIKELEGKILILTRQKEIIEFHSCMDEIEIYFMKKIIKSIYDKNGK